MKKYQGPLIIGGIVLLFLVSSVLFGSNNTSTPSPISSLSPSPVQSTPPIQKTTPTQPVSTFSEISLADQTRLGEIIKGVMQNTIPITPELRNELKNIYSKYNVTDAELNDFAMYGPGFMAYYQQLFWTDAKQSIISGKPVKSDERLGVENLLLEKGLMTPERFASSDELMKSIATNQPIIGSDGKQVVVTESMIDSTLNNLDSAVERIKSLLGSRNQHEINVRSEWLGQ